MRNTLKVRRAERSQELGRHVTQMDVARAVGISPSRCSLIERGEVDPDEDEQLAFAKYYGVDRSVLFPDAAQPEPSASPEAVNS
jgi:transcriptional regulator with XRE-family HTH domain